MYLLYKLAIKFRKIEVIIRDARLVKENSEYLKSYQKQAVIN